MTETTDTLHLVCGTGLLGRCVHYRDGWRFLPNVSGRKGSRRARPTAHDCIPRWAFKASTHLLDAGEWRARRAAAKAKGAAA